MLKLRILLQRLQLYLLRTGFIKDTSREMQLLLMPILEKKKVSGTMGNDLESVGFNTYSPTYEDGILLYIFSQIGMTNKKLVDLGAGIVKGSTVANLIINHGFTGLLVENDAVNFKLLKDYYSRHPETNLFQPKIVAEFIKAGNVNQILEKNGLVDEIDLLCIDLDGMDYWIWKAIDTIRPRVAVIEYQDILGPKRSCTVPYQPGFNADDYVENKDHRNYCGASLQAMVKLGRDKDYRLVGCNKGGWNAFFILNGLGEDSLPEVSVESCFNYEWNRMGMKNRFPLIKEMEWEDV